MAFGTYAVKDENKDKKYIAKTIREIHNAELIRKLQAIIRENGLQEPSVRTLFR